MKEGFPVEKIYKSEVKPIDSHRFNFLTPKKFKKTIMKINEEKKAKRPKSNDGKTTGKELGDSCKKLPESFFDEDNESQCLNKSFD
mmetsp:Transcript_21330/g.24523  ORF Transcript_21330/g.24523 Transcript_21330/m.24523 type:complete len:86 (+) Transcript_21330:2-259(+)